MGPDTRDPRRQDPRRQDPRRWFLLVIVIASAFIVVLDNSVLTVAIPTILRDFDTDLPSLQWVVSGYSLVFATLLIIGGRLGDLFGHRRMFIIGAAIFGGGSLLAALSSSVPMLFVGEALIEGVGAALMMPATVALLSTNFEGHERSTAFAAWATIGGATISFGPLIGGYLTTYHSWRWAFGINVIVAPIAIIGTLLLVRADRREGPRERLDLPGAALVVTGMGLVIFAIIQGSTYGYITPTRDFSLLGWQWPPESPVSIVPVAFVLGLITLVGFFFVERSKERRDASPLLPFALLQHHPRFRYGLLTALLVTLGQFGLFFVLAVVLQSGKGLSAVDTGLWLLPAGLSVVVGAQMSARLTRRFGVVRVARDGMIVEAIGLALVAAVVSADVSLWSLLPGFVMFGLGTGVAVAQVTNISLSDVPDDKAGVAGGANSTVRQTGFALGLATLGSVLTALAVSDATDGVRASGLGPSVKRAAIARLHERGVNFTPPRNATGRGADALTGIFRNALAGGARPALLFAAVTVALAAFVVRWIPDIGPEELRAHEEIREPAPLGV